MDIYRFQDHPLPMTKVVGALQSAEKSVTDVVGILPTRCPYFCTKYVGTGNGGPICSSRFPLV